MSWTLAAFCEDLDPAGAQVNVAAALAEQHLTTSGDDITVPRELFYLFGGLATLEATADLNARLVAPSLRRLNNIMVPQHVGVVACTTGLINYLWPLNPIALNPGEDLNAQINSNPAAAVEQTVLAFLSDGPISPVTGEIYRVRATAASLTTVSASWAFTTLSLTDDLPNGRYRILGAACSGANAVAFRFVGYTTQWRPGGLVMATPDAVENPLQRNGGLGSWMEFDTNQLPGIEFLCGDTAGAGAFEMILDVEFVS